MIIKEAAAGFTNFTRVKELFEQAQSIDPAKREAWLQDACTGDPVMLAELRSMLEVSELGTFPRNASGGQSFSSVQSIGPYRIARELGRGGMGVVYLAMRDDGAFRKSVALKVLLRDQVSPEFVLRFKQERQVVAALDHPNIARILDGGETVDGMPYYVMEYVEGVPLDKYCDQQRLSLTGRIKLFQQVCHAVHYLHLNLIVHRDLKPNNILVSSEGTIKLLDFGIAKVVGAASSSQELTSAQGVPMTPAYASPEQIQGANLQRTSDIYSLGVILYLLLTGRQPYEGIDDKMLKLARGLDPALPSANIREDLRASPESTAQLRRALLGGLDSIVLMAMRYNLKDRYQSAADLANDLQSFLDGQSVTAHHDTVTGRSIKLLKRKRAAIAIASGFLVLGSFGIWQLHRVEVQKAEIAARQQQLSALLEQVEGKAAFAGPESTATHIQDVRQVKKAFATDFTAVAANHPAPSRERDALLDRGVRYLDRIRGSSPVNPQLILEIADAYQQLGLLQEKIARADARNRDVARGTYQKAAAALSAIVAMNPNNPDAQRRLTLVNEQIIALGGSDLAVADSSQTRQDKPAQGGEEPRRFAQVQPSLSQKTSSTAGKRVGSQSAPPAELPPPPPLAPMPQGISSAERAELEEQMSIVEAHVDSADQAIAPVKQNLINAGDGLNAKTAAEISRMHSSLERAKRDLSAENVGGAKENMRVADSLAGKVLKSVGR